MIRWRLLLPMLGLATAACSLDPYHCGTQDRFLDAHAALTGTTPADTGSAELSFLQFRGGETQQSLTWLVRGSVTDTVTAVHIHRASTGDTLFTLTNGYAGPDDVITQSGPQLWSGTVGYDALFDLIPAGDAYVDVHPTCRPDGALHGPLSATSERDRPHSCT